MAELTTRGRDGLPPPSHLPQGECIMTLLPGGRIRIDRADPRILISAELLAQVFIAPAPGVSLSPEHPAGRSYGVGAVLRIDGVNRQVVYRITEYVPRVHGYIGEWPD